MPPLSPILLVTQHRLETLPPPPSDEIPAPPDFANAALHQQRKTTLATHKAALLASMKQMMVLMRNSPTNTYNNRTPCDCGGRQNAHPNGGRGRGLAPSPRQYCWSHGYCAHGSKLCNNQLPGHHFTATATNMQGGSTNNCFWITPA